MASQHVPDDIKIIAQFLAVRTGGDRAWQDHVREASRLRRELKERGGFTLVRKQRSSAPRVLGSPEPRTALSVP